MCGRLLLFPVFVSLFVSLLPRLSFAGEAKSPQSLSKEFQLRLSEASKDVMTLSSYLTNAIDNLELLENNLNLLEKRNVELKTDLERYKNYHAQLQNNNRLLASQLVEAQQELAIANYKKKVALAVGIAVGAALVIGSGVAIGMLTTTNAR